MKTIRILNRSIAACIAFVPLATNAAQQSITAAGDPTVNASDLAVRWGIAANWSGPNGAAIPTATDNAVITYGGTAAAVIDIRASGFTPAGVTTIEDLSFAGAGTGPVTLENNSASSAMVLTLNGGRGAGVPLLQTGTYAITIPNFGPGTTFPLTLQLAASGDINVGTGGLTFGAPISQSGGARSINKTGAGRLTLGNANTFTGGATVSAGILEVTNNNALGTGAAVVNGGTLEINLASAVLSTSSITVNSGGQIATRGTVTLGNPLTLAGGTLATRSSDGGVYAGPITVSAPSFANLRSYTTPTSDLSITISGQLFGSGLITINGNATNATSGRALIVTNTGNLFFSGGFDISAGQTLRNAPATSGRTIGSGNLNLNGGTLQLRDDGTGSAGTLAYGNNVTVQASSVIDVDRVGANLGNTFQLGTLAIGAQTLTTSGANIYAVRFGGTTTLSGAATFNTTTAPLILGGVVGGAFDVTKTGANILQLNAANTYTGLTHVTGGTLVLLGSVAGSPRIDIASGATLDVTAAAGGFTLAGTQTISGAGSVTGVATIGSGGTLQPGDAGGAGTLTFASLNLGSAAGQTSSINFTNSLTPAKVNVTGTDALMANGGANSVTINLPAGGLSPGTYTLIDYAGTLGGSGFPAFKIGTGPTRIVGAGLVENVANTSIDYNITAVDFPIWKGAQSSEWSTATIGPAKNWVLNSNNATTTDFLVTDSVIFNDLANDAAPVVDVSVADVAPFSATFGNVTKPYTITGTKAITGTAVLIKTGAAPLTISNTNTFTGAVTISGGGEVRVAAVANSGVGSPLGAGANITLDDGTLDFTGASGSTNRAVLLGAGGGKVTTAGVLTLAGAITGGNALTKTGTGTVILAGANTYGTTTIASGTLQFGDGITNGTPGAGAIANGGVLAFNNPAALTFSSEITGTGVLAKTGGGSLVLSGAGANTFTGTTTVSGGNLILSKNSGVAAVGRNIVVATGGTVSYGTTAGQMQDQIPDTANISIEGGSFGSGAGDAQAVPTAGITDTVANVTINSGTFNSGRNALVGAFRITGLLKITGGNVLVQRGGGLSAEGVEFTGGALNLDGGSTTPGQQSKLTVGAGGLLLSSHTINFNAGPSALAANSVGSVMLLNGNVTSTGESALARLNPTVITAEVDLAGSVRTFDVTGTLTVAPDVGNPVADLAAAGILKTGAGKLLLTGAQHYSSLTNANGRTDVTNAIGTGASSVTVSAGSVNFSASQTLASLTIGDGAQVTIGSPLPPAPAQGDSFGDEGAAFFPAAVPEPGSLSLGLSGLSILLGIRARRTTREW